jgi:hypothetical protein
MPIQSYTKYLFLYPGNLKVQDNDMMYSTILKVTVENNYFRPGTNPEALADDQFYYTYYDGGLLFKNDDEHRILNVKVIYKKAI